jgi:hypothetical protein
MSDLMLMANKWNALVMEMADRVDFNDEMLLFTRKITVKNGSCAPFRL